jgi:hypothetical protein
LGVAFVMTSLLIPMTFAADKPGQPPPSTDDELLKSLNEKGGDDYDRQLLGPSGGSKPATRGPEAEKLQDRLQRELGSAAQREDEQQNPLLTIAREMRQAEGMIRHTEVGDGTQHLQRQIVSDLDKLIEQAKQSSQCKPCSKPQETTGRTPQGSSDVKPKPSPGEGGKTPSETPSRNSDPKVTTPARDQGHRDPAAARAMLEKIWSLDLPAREREQMLELPPEEFLPKYETQIEDYFRQLSEGKAGKGTER